MGAEREKPTSVLKSSVLGRKLIYKQLITTCPHVKAVMFKEWLALRESGAQSGWGGPERLGPVLL